MFDALEAYYNGGANNGPYLAQWDFNDDGILVGYGADADTTTSDAKVFIEDIVGTHFGDANLDGSVNALDMNVIGQNWLDSVDSWNGGDLNGDGVVDTADLNLLGKYWQQ